ncbi:trypsin-1-like [Epargyreus clarus]|uniref:trypsin-1-like n=1 Tax=Epargyreus clarus TaxID=520877 RepID=UPI003C2B3B9A
MYPYVAVIFINRKGICGGSIISHRTILTAAHCTIERGKKGHLKPDAFEVRLGSSFFNHGVLYKVCKVVPHELYSRSLYFYDIAVLMLGRRIKFGSSVRKVGIAPDNTWRKEKYSFTVAGFGMVSVSLWQSDVSAKLRATRMKYVESRTCNQSQSSKPMIVPDHMFCMIGQRWTSDCFGDSGSGIVWKGYLVGIVATGRDNFCGGDMMPSMYTDVYFFRQWIESKIIEADALTNRDCDSATEMKAKRKILYRSNS